MAKPSGGSAGVAHPVTLPIAMATRAYAVPVEPEQKRRSRRHRPKHEGDGLPRVTLVFDCETTIDVTQRLTFGAYRVYEGTTLIEEGLIYADDLPNVDRATLQAYVRRSRSEAPSRYDVTYAPLQLLSRNAFAELFYRLAYKLGALVVGFNLPFDLSRLAVAVGEARGHDAGGFSLQLWDYLDTRDGQRKDHQYRPRLVIQSLDSKRAFIRFTSPRRANRTNRAPFPGHFLDLRTLAFALTGEGQSLASACTVFNVAHGKDTVEEHGQITPEYISYCRHDVRATWELYGALRTEYATHPIDLVPTGAYSPASIGKAYLQAMRVTVPPLNVAPDLDLSTAALHGAAMQSYYGGRAEVRIRRTPVPVVYVDFTSMYPTVNALMGQWELLTAKTLMAVDATDDVVRFLDTVTTTDLFEPETWRQFAVLVQVIPTGDVLPVRTTYPGSLDYQIGINHLHASTPVWYTLADVIAAKLLGGTVPRIVRAVRFVPDGRQRMRRIRLGGNMTIDPRHDDFFRAVIEQRAQAKTRAKSAADATTRAQWERVQQALKILANSTSYGIYVEMNRQEGKSGDCTIWTGEDASFRCEVQSPEEPGAYLCPPLATLITGAAHLMLALLERAVRDAGGFYALCDTDSMAIVATEHGGLEACGGGPEVLPNGSSAVPALSWEQVQTIVDRFASLNPYNRAAVPGSVLKIESDNYAEGRQRQLWCYAISAKRYALYAMDDGIPHVVKASEHGLGHLLAPGSALPTDSKDSYGKDWISAEWEAIVREALGLSIEQRSQLEHATMARQSVSKPRLLRAFAAFNRGKPYVEQVKPFNFMLSVTAAPTLTGDRAPLLLVAPYETDARKRRKLQWVNVHDGQPHRITTESTDASGAVCVQSYRSALAAYRYHPETKSGDAQGQPCGKQTVGLLRRLHLQAVDQQYIGKEANKLEEVQSGLVCDPDEVYTTYARTGGGEALRTAIQRLHESLGLGTLAQQAGITVRGLQDILAGRAMPHPDTATALKAAVYAHVIEQLERLGEDRSYIVSLPLGGLIRVYLEKIEADRTACLRTLQDLSHHATRSVTAAAMSVPLRTLERWLAASSVPADVSILAALKRRTARYHVILVILSELERERHDLSTQIDALRCANQQDPHAPHVQWLDRIGQVYDREAWRLGRLQTVRRSSRNRQQVTIDYTTVLDPVAQELGEDVATFMDALKEVQERIRSLTALRERVKSIDALIEEHRQGVANALQTRSTVV